ncbi:MAG: N utilization substance protein B [Puniceicoccaceae bacterium 5H]|nr:MAG: N utilization substance protein B [Puniceicoccaceae bacterium 5H]
MQYLFQWSFNPPERPTALHRELQAFFRTIAEDKIEEDPNYYSFAEELIYGVLDNVDEVDEVVKRYAKNWDFNRIARIDLAILRLAIYEMMERRDIPPIVSINEAIDLSKEYSNPDAKRFINGILDQYKLTLDRPLRTAE